MAIEVSGFSEDLCLAVEGEQRRYLRSIQENDGDAYALSTMRCFYKGHITLAHSVLLVETCL